MLVRVHGRKWTHVHAGVVAERATEVPGYEVILDTGATPVRIVVKQKGSPSMRGVLRLDKDELTFCYTTDPDCPFPVNFDEPKAGERLMKAARQRPRATDCV